MLDGAGDLAVLAEIQKRILAETVQPDPAPGVAIADTHRDHPDMRRAAMAGVERGGHDFADNAHRNRAERIAAAVLAGKDDLRTAADGAWAGCRDAEIGRRRRMRLSDKGRAHEKCCCNKLIKTGAHGCPQADKLRLPEQKSPRRSIRSWACLQV